MNKNFTKYFNITIIALFIFAIGFSSYAQNPRYIDSRDLAVMLSTAIEKDPVPKITIKWEKNELALQYQVSRKLKDDLSWSAPLATVDSSVTEYTDFNVQIGKSYEYQVSALSLGSVILQFTVDGKTVDSTVAINFVAFGYIYTGIEIPALDNFGKVLLLVEEGLAFDLSAQLVRLEEDLISEGWTVVRKLAPRAETFDGQLVKNTKQIVLDEYNLDPQKLSAIFIIGRVAVPYSGSLNPDGHGDHIGAWPADLYYGYMNEGAWNDVAINNVSAGRQENKNIPGDGKFDMTTYQYGSVDVPVGRVDFYNMPLFTKSEKELLEKYLDKDHAYRVGEFKAEIRGLIDDNFGARRYIEGFASSGWRNLGALVGTENVKKVDWFTTLKTDTYLWAYGTGGGTYTSAGGIGNTKQFDTIPVNAVFTMMFGSYFGDWDSQNNFLRASLASQPAVLTCSWAGRPHWYYHHMAMGEPLSYSIKLTQNNWTTYVPNAYYLSGTNPTIYAIGMKNIHVEQLGDPTLRMYMNTVPPPKNLTVIQPPGKHIEINWEAADSQEPVFYNVYRAFDQRGPFEKINDEMLTETNFTESQLFDGQIYYMVRTIRLEETLLRDKEITAFPQFAPMDKEVGGSFYNTSRGIIQSVMSTEADEEPSLQFSFAAAPNPATTYVNLTLTLSNTTNVNIDIYDIAGVKIKHIASRLLGAGSQVFSWDLTDMKNNKATPGVYFAKLTSSGQSAIAKIVVMP